MSVDPEPPGQDDVSWNPAGNEEFLDDLRDSDEVDLDLSNALPCEFEAAGVRVELAQGCNFRAARSTVQRIGESVVQHLAPAKEQIEGAVDLLITVVEADSRIGKISQVAISVKGKVGPSEIAFEVRATRSGSRLHSGLLSFIIQTTFEALGTLKKHDTPPLQACFDQCIADICLKLDRAIRRPEPLSAVVYRVIDHGRWLMGLPTAGYIGYVAWKKHGADGIQFPFFMTLISFFAIVSLLQGINGVWAPRSFYTETPRGRREAARLGVQSIWLHRLKSLFITVVFGLGCLLIALMVGVIDLQ